jgi:hypothetical protein
MQVDHISDCLCYTDDGRLKFIIGCVDVRTIYLVRCVHGGKETECVQAGTVGGRRKRVGVRGGGPKKKSCVVVVVVHKLIVAITWSQNDNVESTSS